MAGGINKALDVDRIAELREIYQLLPYEAFIHAIFPPPIMYLIPAKFFQLSMH